MTARRSRIVALALSLLCFGTARATVLTGSLRAASAQPVVVPMGSMSPTVLRYYLGDGQTVKKGQVVLRIDAGQQLKQVRDLSDKLAEARATTAQKVAKLRLKVVDAQLALVEAEATRDKAKLEAAVPKSLITGLKYDRYQGAYRKGRLQAVQAVKALADARAAVTRAIHDGELSQQKLQNDLHYAKRDVEHASVRADEDGVLVHAFAGAGAVSGVGKQFRQGSSVYVGTRVGSVVSGHRFTARAWALAAERDRLHVGQAVGLAFDALPGVSLIGHVSAISGAGEQRPSWGRGIYYAVDVALPADAAKLPLSSGMSVRVDSGHVSAAGSGGNAPVANSDAVIRAQGNLVARQSVAIVPPAIPQVWQMRINHMAADGSRVKKGEVVVQFAAGKLRQELPSRLSELAEKQRELKQLRMSLADDARTARLATAKAIADADKAKRKAEEPAKLIAGIDYKKLVIDRRAAERTLTLTRRRQQLAAAERKAKLTLLVLQVGQAQKHVTTLRTALAKLAVKAPASGVFLHALTWSGSKIDTGSQVFRGRSVASIPDIDTLAVKATLPERDLQRVHVGEPVQVQISGADDRSLSGHVRDIGNTVHSQSDVAPVPVVDLMVDLDGTTHGLRPGQPVQVVLKPGKGAKR